MNIKDKLLLSFASLGNLVGGVAQNIFIIFWFGHYKNPYGILLITSLTFPIVFGLITLLTIKLKSWKLEKPDIIAILKIGAFNALNGILIIYSIRPDRLPPIFQQIILNFTIFFTILGNKYVLDDKKRYISLRPMIGLILIFSSIMLYTIPLLLAKSSRETILNLVIWTFINIIGQFFGAMYNVYQSLYIEQRTVHNFLPYLDSSDIVERDKIGKYPAIMTLLTYSTFVQSIIIAFCWFVDIIPFFGLHTPIEFFNNYKYIFICNFTDQCGNAYLHYILFASGYIITYLSSAYFNVTSAPFGQMFTVLISPIVILFWITFPDLDPHKTEIQFYIPLISITLSTLGLLLWKHWEINEEKKVYTKV